MVAVRHHYITKSTRSSRFFLRVLKWEGLGKRLHFGYFWVYTHASAVTLLWGKGRQNCVRRNTKRVGDKHMNGFPTVMYGENKCCHNSGTKVKLKNLLDQISSFCPFRMHIILLKMLQQPQSIIILFFQVDLPHTKYKKLQRRVLIIFRQVTFITTSSSLIYIIHQFRIAHLPNIVVILYKSIRDTRYALWMCLIWSIILQKHYAPTDLVL